MAHDYYLFVSGDGLLEYSAYLRTILWLDSFLLTDFFLRIYLTVALAG